MAYVKMVNCLFYSRLFSFKIDLQGLLLKQFYRNFQVFNGNTDSETVVYNNLPISIKTRFIRLLPMQWKNQISMRIEVYGCPGIKLIMLEKIGLFYNRVSTFFLHKHSPLRNSL